jgi:hypothetical protein
VITISLWRKTRLVREYIFKLLKYLLYFRRGISWWCMELSRLYHLYMYDISQYISSAHLLQLRCIDIWPKWWCCEILENDFPCPMFLNYQLPRVVSKIKTNWVVGFYLVTSKYDVITPEVQSFEVICKCFFLDRICDYVTSVIVALVSRRATISYLGYFWSGCDNGVI